MLYSAFKVKFGHANNFCERVFETAKLASANKTKGSITSKKRGLHEFW